MISKKDIRDYIYNNAISEESSKEYTYQLESKPAKFLSIWNELKESFPVDFVNKNGTKYLTGSFHNTATIDNNKADLPKIWRKFVDVIEEDEYLERVKAYLGDSFIPGGKIVVTFQHTKRNTPSWKPHFDLGLKLTTEIFFFNDAETIGGEHAQLKLIDKYNPIDKKVKDFLHKRITVKNDSQYVESVNYVNTNGMKSYRFINNGYAFHSVNNITSGHERCSLSVKYIIPGKTTVEII